MALLTGLRHRRPSPKGSLSVLLPAASSPPWGDSLAHVVSAVLSPPVLAAVMLTVAGAATQMAAAWIWAGVALASSVLAPVGYLLWLHRRGLVSDLDVQRRGERPLAFTLTALAVTAATLWLGSAPALLRGLSTAHLVQMTLVLLITLRWKISMHGATIAACVALLLYLVGPHAAPVLIAVPLVAWSRVRLHRHTLSQTVAGAALGGLIMWSVLRWIAVK